MSRPVIRGAGEEGRDAGGRGAGGIFIEIDYCRRKKRGEHAAGDVFMSRRNASGSRLVTVLSDGLGSGVKANVLASLTATMISQFVLMDIPPERAAELIVNSLPVCSVRRLAYATFTLLDARHDMSVRMIEYDNPPLLILREDALLSVRKRRVPLKRRDKTTGPQDETLLLSRLTARAGDRLVFFSDGVTQAGLGSARYPSGWGIAAVKKYVLSAVGANPAISAGELARKVVAAAEEAAGAGGPNDDTSCGVLYFRKPRNALVVTGPPFRPSSDKEFARLFAAFDGRKIIAGGTSAAIIARELGRTIDGDDSGYDASLPRASRMEGADLVCEGIVTLGAVAEELSRDAVPGPARNPAARMKELLLDSDKITFVVGTKINEAHHDPSLPVELEIRRAVVKKIASLLEEKYLKAAYVRYI